MKFLIFACSILFLSLSLSAQTSTAEYSRVKIDLRGTSIGEVAKLGLEADHGVYARGRHLINDFSKEEIALLEANGFKYEILIEDVQAYYVAQNHTHHNHDHGQEAQHRDQDNCEITNGNNYITPSNYEYGSMGGYLTYDELLVTLDEMQSLYPNLITAKAPIGTITTHEGRPIYWLKVSDNPTVKEAEPELLYTALHHAREANSLSQMVFYLWYLLENYDTDPEVKYLLDNTEMYFIPCVNPDGYIHNEMTNPNGGGLWRKNRWMQDGSVYGVDLNRNYGYNWGFDDNGSSPNRNSQTFRGTAGFSEPETQAVRDFCNEHEFKITLNYHTYGNLLIYPWGYSDQHTADSATFVNFGQAMTKENNFRVGTGTETVGYVVNGDSDDWMYGEESTKPAIFSLTPEVGPGSYGFWPPQSAIDDLNKSALLQNLTAAHLLHNYGEVEEENAVTTLDSKTGNVDLKIKKYGLQSGNLLLGLSSLDNKATVTTSPMTFSMAHLDEASFSFDYTISDGVAFGDEITFLVELDNGQFTTTDTLRKRFLSGQTTVIYTDNGDSPNDWETADEWGITTSTFVTSPSSYTDSPNGDYQSGAFSTMTLKEPIDLQTANQAFLSFSAKWSIETDYDFVQVLASSDGTNFSPLCGKYTNFGVADQILDEPLYDGTQLDWVEEEMDLSDYVGTQVWIQFVLVSDGYLELDGFYFDDLSVITIEDKTTGVGETPLATTADFDVYPNPFSGSFQVNINKASAAKDLSIRLINGLGQVVAEQRSEALTAGTQDFRFEEAAMLPGIYFVQVYIDGVNVGNKKVVSF